MWEDAYRTWIRTEYRKMVKLKRPNLDFNNTRPDTIPYRDYLSSKHNAVSVKIDPSRS
jgi:hypothetical protein